LLHRLNISGSSLDIKTSTYYRMQFRIQIANWYFTASYIG
jgi:hypothetical protein